MLCLFLDLINKTKLVVHILTIDEWYSIYITIQKLYKVQELYYFVLILYAYNFDLTCNYFIKMVN